MRLVTTLERREGLVGSSVPVDQMHPGEDALGDLAEFEDGAEATRVERIVEAQIIEELRKVEFDPDSPEWRELSGALMEYGYAVLVAWGATGSLYRRAACQGVRGLARIPKHLPLSSAEAKTLALDVVMDALEAFRTKSLPGWRPDGGASLKTFFIGRCLMEFPDVYQKWYAKELAPIPAEPFRTVDDGRFGACTDEDAGARVWVDELFEDDPILRTAFELQQSGYSLREIVKILNFATPMTLPKLRTDMHTFRERAKRRYPNG